MKTSFKISFGILFLGLVNSSFAQIYNPQWAQVYGNSNTDFVVGHKVESYSNNEFGLLISYGDSIELEVSGTPQTYYGSPSSTVFVHTDSIGDPTWVYNSGPGMFTISNFFLNSSDELLSFGYFMGTIDADPGPGVASHTTSALYAGIVSALDINGNYIWSREFNGTGQFEIWDVAEDNSGNLYLLGYTEAPSTIDLDPGPGVVNYSPVEASKVLIKLDPLGNFMWFKTFELTNPQIWYTSGNKMVIDKDNIYIYGSYVATEDFDPGAGTDFDTAISGDDCFITKLNNNGDYQWSHRFASFGGPDSLEFFRDITFDGDSNIYISGLYTSSIDVDPGSGIHILPLNCMDCIEDFILKLNSSGEFVWAYATRHVTTGISDGPSIGYNHYTNEVIMSISHFTGSADLDYSSGSYNLSNFSSSPYTVLVHLDSSGGFLWARGWPELFQIDIDVENGRIMSTGLIAATTNVGTATTPINIGPSGVMPTAYLREMYFNIQSFDGHVFTTPTTAVDSCDGTGLAHVIGGNPPYAFYWETQIDSDNMQSLDSACYGIHTLKIVDAIGDSVYVDYYVTDSANYYNWNTSLPLDTAFLYHENCALDYSLPIDSAFLTGFNYLYDDIASTGQFYFAEITYFQSGNTYVFGDTVLINNNQNVLFYFAIYCPTKALPDNKIILLSSSSGVLHLASTEISSFEIYPNPATHSFSVRVNSEYDHVMVYDLTGKVVIDQDSSKNSTIDVTNCPAGLYFVTLFNDDIPIGTKKLVIGN